VTGAAGFVGSHLAERLLARGATVVGVDSFSDYYDRAAKQANLAGLVRSDRFELHELDLAADDLTGLAREADVIFHEAGQPGVGASWGDDFALYLRDNEQATQRLLEASLGARRLERFVYASSSSVYGDADELPVTERTVPRPVSPYGVTKLAGEHLCGAYGRLGVPTVSLRYFTVYGPRQRPDMAFTKFIRATLNGGEITIHGDGEQSRDFTYVADIVEGSVAAGDPSRQLSPGAVYNLGGGSPATINRVLAILERATGRAAHVRYDSVQPGDARHTHADCSAAARDLGFEPRTTLEEGLRQQVAWVQREMGRMTNASTTEG
jgi:nucleoside-diphosphate-sugar epimerase